MADLFNPWESIRRALEYAQQQGYTIAPPLPPGWTVTYRYKGGL